MAGHGLGRSERHHARPRTLYALLFDDGGCYVGQSADPRQREAQHRSRRGGWGRPFRFHALEVMQGTKAEAETHEQAWRVLAQNAGWRIYGKPPRLAVNPHRRLSPRVRVLMMQRRWPLESRGAVPSDGVNWWGWVVLVAAALTLGRCVTG